MSHRVSADIRRWSGDDRTLSATLALNSWAECCLPFTEGKKIMSRYEQLLARGQSSEALGEGQVTPCPWLLGHRNALE